MGEVVVASRPPLEAMEIACGRAAGQALTTRNGSGLLAGTCRHQAHGDLVIVAMGCPASCCGTFIGLTADEARNFAAAVLRSADRVDGGQGKQ